MKPIQETHKDIMTELAWKDLINAIRPKDIGVSVNKGAVILRGTIDSYSKKIAVEKIVAGIPGIRSISNEIVVNPIGSDKRKDIEITEDILNALDYCSDVTEDVFNMKIEGEWLTIEGEVENVFGNKVTVNGKVCKLEEKVSQKNSSEKSIEIIKNEVVRELAYWEVFG